MDASCVLAEKIIACVILTWQYWDLHSTYSSFTVDHFLPFQLFKVNQINGWSCSEMGKSLKTNDISKIKIKHLYQLFYVSNYLNFSYNTIVFMITIKRIRYFQLSIVWAKVNSKLEASVNYLWQIGPCYQCYLTFLQSFWLIEYCRKRMQNAASVT